MWKNLDVSRMYYFGISFGVMNVGGKMSELRQLVSDEEEVKPVYVDSQRLKHVEEPQTRINAEGFKKR